MTAKGIEERLAAIETTLAHVRESVDKAETQRHDQRREAADETKAVRDRLTRLEARAVSPEEVHENTLEAAVTKALRASVGRMIGWAITGGALVASIVFGVLTLTTGN